MKLTGHKTLGMFTRYNTVDQQDAIMAIAMLDSYLAEQNVAKSSDNVQTSP